MSGNLEFVHKVPLTCQLAATLLMFKSLIFVQFTTIEIHVLTTYQKVSLPSLDSEISSGFCCLIVGKKRQTAWLRMPTCPTWRQTVSRPKAGDWTWDCSDERWAINHRGTQSPMNLWCSCNNFQTVKKPHKECSTSYNLKTNFGPFLLLE